MPTFIEKVKALRTALDISIHKEMKEAVMEMSLMMDVPTTAPDGAAVPLPQQVESLMVATGVEVNENRKQSEVECVESDEESSGEESSDDVQEVCAVGGASCSTTGSAQSKKKRQRVVKKFENKMLKSIELGKTQPEFASPAPRMQVECLCGRRFSHRPAWTTHTKFCTKILAADELMPMWRSDLTERDVDVEAQVGDLMPAVNDGGDECGDGDGAPAAAAQPDGPEIVRGRPVKLRRDGQAKQSGLKEGDRKTPHTLLYKYRVIQEYDRLIQKKAEGVISNPLDRTVRLFQGLSKSNIHNWYQQRDALRRALTHETAGLKVSKKTRTGQLITFSSRAARKCTLHPGRGSIFTAAEEELYALFKRERRVGKRVLDRWFSVTMRKLVRQHYGDEAGDTFRASKGWLLRFANRNNLSLRRGNNHKHQTVAERLPKIKRWHARLRRRLMTGPAARLHAKWGRWLPENRLSVDQVPCNLREGAKATYEEKGTNRIWLAGTKADDGKRFCTLQIIARAVSGPAGAPRRGQPRIGVIFRGQGKRISQEEKAAWHPDVDVRFQPKAWADAEYCEAHARKEMAAATKDARARGQESVVFYDNLHGQTTPEHETILKEKAKAIRHLLPSGVTSEIQLIDDGVGYRVKQEMGHALDLWLEKEDNLARWTGEGPNAIPMWQKRVLITQLLAAAWERVCAAFDFERAATRIGMRMTVDGTGDDSIKLQGVPDYTFCAADGGPINETDDGVDPTEQAALDALIPEEGGQEDDEVVDSPEIDAERENCDSSDEVDDTADQVDTIGSAPEEPPAPFHYDGSECPQLETDEDLRKLVGKYILHAMDSNGACGWYIGKVVARGVSARDLRNTPTANFVVLFERRLTKNANLVGRVACTLTPDRYGREEWWVMLSQD